MNILNKLTVKNLMLNKKRTLVTIIGIVLSVALICAITTFVSSMQGSLVKRVKQTNGDYHIEITNIAKEDIKYIQTNQQIKKYMLTADIGYSYLKDVQNEYKPYLFLLGMNQNALEGLPVHLLEGRLPENENEVIISSHIESNGKVPYKIGDKINLTIGNRILEDGEELWQDNPLQTEEETNNSIEKLTKIEKRTVTIVGIMERPNFENYSAPGYTILTKMSDEEILKKDHINTYFSLINSSDAYTFGQEIGKNLQETENGTTLVRYNDELLRFQGITRRNSYMITFITIAAIVIAIIMFTSIFVIKNSFNISITERLKQYGMLSSIGATSKQIKKNVLFEGFILGLIAIPLGIIIGLVAISIVLVIVQNILNSAGNIIGFDIIISISWVAILVAVLTSIVTIFLSSLIPAIKASKISPIDAIRQTKDIQIKGKKLKTSKLFHKIFGIEGDIANKNLKRSRKKYRTTVFSIVISIVLFISMSTVITYGFKVTSLVYEKQEYNVNISCYGGERVDYDVNLQFYHEVEKLDKIKRSSILKKMILSFDVQKYASDTTKEKLTQQYEQAIEDNKSSSTDDSSYINYLKEQLTIGNIMLCAVGDREYQRYIQSLGLNYEEVKDHGILYDTTISVKDGVRVEYKGLKVKAGENFVLKDFDREKEEYTDQHSIKIVAVADQLPLGLRKIEFGNMQAYIIISDQLMNNFDFYVENMYIQTDSTLDLINEINKLEHAKKFTIYDTDSEVRENNAIVLVISIFFYGFIIVISIIGITNIFNTITTNMALRSNEFAVLRSIGMTDKEFKKMINFESLLYGLKALLIGLPLGIGISYFIYQAMGGIYQTDGFMFPLKEVIISIVFVFLIIFLTMKYSINKIKKQNIIETIRQENI